MIRKRFFPVRLPRIAAWTAMAIGWVTAIVARASAVTPETASAPEIPEPAIVEQTPTTPVAAPVLPERGIVVVRHTPAPPQEPVTVTRRVVVQQARAQTTPAASPPTRTTSSGS